MPYACLFKRYLKQLDVAHGVQFEALLQLDYYFRQVLAQSYLNLHVVHYLKLTHDLLDKGHGKVLAVLHYLFEGKQFS